MAIGVKTFELELQTHYSNAQFWDFIQQPENQGKKFELWDGRIIEMASPSFLHNLVVNLIAYFITDYLMKNPLGYATGHSTDYELDEGVILQPDASFVSYANAPQNLASQCNFAPDLAVEVVSPSNTPDEILYKVEAYLKYGTRLVWVVYPKEQMVLVYKQLSDGSLNLRRLKVTDSLTAEEVLPNFQVAVKQLFPIMEEDHTEE